MADRAAIRGRVDSVPQRHGDPWLGMRRAVELRRRGAAKAMVAALCGAEGEHTHRRMPGLQGFAAWRYNPYRIGMVE
jgi:hypothetical protein